MISALTYDLDVLHASFYSYNSTLKFLPLILCLFLVKTIRIKAKALTFRENCILGVTPHNMHFIYYR